MVAMWWPPSLRNRNLENYRELSHNPGDFIKFYEAKQSFYYQSIEKYTLNISFSTLHIPIMQRGCQDFRFEVRNGYGVEI